MAKKAEEATIVSSNPGLSELADALRTAIESARPQKITPATRKQKGTPWTPPAGEAKLKLKRKYYHHGLEVENRLSNEEIALLNQLKPGKYCDGWVEVKRRKDKGFNIDYKIRTAAQRLRLNQFGITSFTSLLQRIVKETENPSLYSRPEDLDE